jgi:hypothetical protein
MCWTLSIRPYDAEPTERQGKWLVDIMRRVKRAKGYAD